MYIRFWNGNKIIADITISGTGFAMTSSPSMPNNVHEMPDIEIDPIVGFLKFKNCEVLAFDEIRALAERIVIAEDKIQEPGGESQ